MNTGAFGEGFPYSNFHDLNMDWIIKIAKDFLDQYTNIQTTIENGLIDIDEKTQQGINDLQEKADDLESALNAWYETHSDDIAEELQNAITSFTEEANEIAQQVIATIPADYTTLSNRVTEVYTKALLSANNIISENSVATIIPSGDLNDVYENNRIYYCAQLTSVQNKPVNSMTGILMIVKYSSNNPAGTMQIYYGNNGVIAYRISHGTAQDLAWYAWNTVDASQYVKSSNTILSDNTLSTVLPSGDLNDLYNSQYIYYCNLTNATHQALPLMSGILIITKYSTVNAYGTTQIYLGNDGTIAFRNSHGSSSNWTWDEWTIYSYSDFQKSSRIILSNNSLLSLIPTGDLDDFYQDQKIYYCAGLTEALNQPVSRLDGMFMIYKYNPSSYIGLMQIYYSNRGEVYFRTSHGNTVNWDYWKLIGNKINRYTCSIFKKVVCCGDSYVSGYSVDTDSNAHRYNPEYSWPTYLEKITGQQYINCGVSGANTVTWQEDIRGLNKAKQAGKAQAYILSLMINDSSDDTTRHIDVGAVSDIGTNRNTYYAQYSKIIRELATISPNAFIFVTTIPNTDTERYGAYNQAVRDIYTAYAETYNIHLLDLYNYRGLYYVSSILLDERSGHYTPAGYEQFAEIFSFVISEYINNNVRKFIDVNQIPYDEIPTLEAINLILSRTTTTDANNSTSSYFRSYCKYTEINGYIYFSGYLNILQSIGSAVNNVFPELPLPNNTDVLFNQHNLDGSVSEKYMHWNTNNSSWRLEGAQTAGSVLYLFGKYLKAT